MLCDAWYNLVLLFDGHVACAYVDTSPMWCPAGQSFTPADCLNSASARSCGIAVATRDVSDFDDIGIEIVDPWAGA